MMQHTHTPQCFNHRSTPAPDIERCDCWVAHPGISKETRFQLRWGAHSKVCPVYRESSDPVDRAYDNDLRRHGEAGRMNRHPLAYA